MSEVSDDRKARLEARRRRREQRRLSLDTDEEGKTVNGMDESDVDVGGRSRSSTTDSELDASRALTREEKRQERREKRRQREIAEKAKEAGGKSAAVITDFSKREIRERRPSDPDVLSGDSESVDDVERGYEQQNAKHETKKSDYGAYASALRRDSHGGDVDKRKQRYAAAVEGYHIDDDDDIDLEPSDDPHAQQPEVMCTSPVKRIKDDYLSSASGTGKVVPHSEEQPTPHHLTKQWPPPRTSKDEDEDEQEPRKGVVKTFEEVDAPEEDRGVDEGHVESVHELQLLIMAAAYLVFVLLAIAYGGKRLEGCTQAPAGQKGGSGTGTPPSSGSSGHPGSPGSPGPTGPPGPSQRPSGFSRRWKQCVWRYGVHMDDRDFGLLHECDFVKLKARSYLRVVYMGNLRIAACTNCCKRWYFTFNDRECTSPEPIDGSVYQSHDLNIHRPTNIEGYCGGIAAGKVRVGFNVGNCAGRYNAGNAWTSWNQASRIIIEEVDPPVA